MKLPRYTLFFLGFCIARCVVLGEDLEIPDVVEQPETVVIGGETITVSKKKFEPTFRDVAYGPD